MALDAKNKPWSKERIITIGFYGGLAIKAGIGLVEFIAGFLMMIINHEWLYNFIHTVAASELREDPQDVIMNYFVKIGQNLSISSQYSTAIYLLLHGGAKLVVIWLLWKKKIWAYPLAVVVFGVFIAYETYHYFDNHSALLLLIIIVDIAIVILILWEYKNLKAEKAKQENVK